MEKIKWGHFFLVFAVSISLAAFLYILVIPIIFWGIYGEGASSDRIGRLPIIIFIGEWAALIIVLVTILVGVYVNIRQRDLRRAKSYLVVAVVLTAMYLFRIPILDVAFAVFQ